MTSLDRKRSSSFPRVPVSGPIPAATNRRLLDCVEDMLATRGASFDHSEQQPAAACPRRAPRPAPRVLLVDDDPDYIRALQIRLESRGIAVLRATTGLDGFCSAVGEPTDAILLDYQLPNGCGNFILEQLKSNLATRGIPVIVISGSKDRAPRIHPGQQRRGPIHAQATRLRGADERAAQAPGHLVARAVPTCDTSMFGSGGPGESP